MIETLDIFYIVLAFAVLWVTLFVCWLIYQVVMTLKSVNNLMNELKWQVEKVEQVLGDIKTKFETSSGHLSKLAAHMKKMVDEMRGKKIK